MGFLAPYMLWGSLAAGIPVALHFFFRSRYRIVPWAAMKFLLTSVEQTSRRLRFQELLLLLLRMAMLVLLALAFSRPLSSTIRGAGQGEAVDAVLLFDTSYSMGASDGPRTRLERAQDSALRIIDQLPPHSTVQIVAGADRAALLGPRSPANLDQARGIVQDLKVTSLATDLSWGITEAAGVLKRAQASNKEFFVFSDLQKLGWEKEAGKIRQAMHEIKEQSSVNLVRCGTRPIKNVTVTGIASQSGVPRPGERVDFAVLVRNTGRESVQNLEVSLLVDGDIKNGETQPLPRLDPGETRSITMTGKLEKAGLRVLTAQVKHDDLPGDNRFDYVIQVRDQVNVLVVDGGANEKEPVFSSSYFLMHALLPVREAEYSRYYLQPRLTVPRLASPALLNKQDLCILVNVPMPSEDRERDKTGLHPFLEELSRFVREGHGLLIYTGDQVLPQAYNKVLGEQYGLLPLPLKTLKKFQPKEALHINRDTFNMAAYQKFKEAPFFKDFANISILRAFEVDETPPQPEQASQSRTEEEEPPAVALRYNSGMPAAVARKFGKGEVMLITTAAEPGIDPDSLAPTWSDWPSRGLAMFVPFVDVTVNYLLHGVTQDHNLVAGKTLHWYPTEKLPPAYTLVHPDGRQTRLGIPEKNKDRHVVTASDLFQAGVYRLVPTASASPVSPTEEPGDTAGSTNGVPLGVVPDLNESEDLDSLTNAQLDEMLGFEPNHQVAGSTEVQESGYERLNREWTMWLLGALLLLVVGESLLAWWCGRAW